MKYYAWIAGALLSLSYTVPSLAVEEQDLFQGKKANKPRTSIFAPETPRGSVPEEPAASETPPMHGALATPAEERPAPPVRHRVSTERHGSDQGILTELSQTILLSQKDFSGLTDIGLRFSRYFKTSAGWFVDSLQGEEAQQLIHGPILLANLAAANPSIVTPFGKIGTLSLFHRTQLEDEDYSSRATGLYSAFGIDIFMTEHFSMMIQKMTIFLDTAIPDFEEADTKVKHLTQSQIMFQFLF